MLSFAASSKLHSWTLLPSIGRVRRTTEKGSRGKSRTRALGGRSASQIGKRARTGGSGRGRGGQAVPIRRRFQPDRQRSARLRTLRQRFFFLRTDGRSIHRVRGGNAQIPTRRKPPTRKRRRSASRLLLGTAARFGILPRDGRIHVVVLRRRRRRQQRILASRLQSFSHHLQQRHVVESTRFALLLLQARRFAGYDRERRRRGKSRRVREAAESERAGRGFVVARKR